MPIGPEPTPVPDLTPQQLNQASNMVANAYRNNLSSLANALSVNDISRKDALRILQDAIDKIRASIQMAPF